MSLEKVGFEFDKKSNAYWVEKPKKMAGLATAAVKAGLDLKIVEVAEPEFQADDKAIKVVLALRSELVRRKEIVVEAQEQADKVKMDLGRH